MRERLESPRPCGWSCVDRKPAANAGVGRSGACRVHDVDLAPRLLPADHHADDRLVASDPLAVLGAFDDGVVDSEIDVFDEVRGDAIEPPVVVPERGC